MKSKKKGKKKGKKKPQNMRIKKNEKRMKIKNIGMTE